MLILFFILMEVTFEEAKDLRREGYKAVNLHLHSSASYDVAKKSSYDPCFLYVKARRAGMDFFTLTEHDTLDSLPAIADFPGVIPAAEITIRPRPEDHHLLHINVFNLTNQHFSTLKTLASESDFDGFLSYIEHHHLPATYNHPLWFEVDESPTSENVALTASRIVSIAKKFSVIELNAGRVKSKNDIALLLAKQFDKGIVASTDSHIGKVADAYTLAKGDTFEEVFDNIAKGNSHYVRKDLTLPSFFIEASTRLNDILNAPENTYAGEIGNKIADSIFDSLRRHKNNFAARAVAKGITIPLSTAGAMYYVTMEEREARFLEGHIFPKKQLAPAQKGIYVRS